MPQLEASALQCGDVIQLDERTCKDWIKECSTEASIRELNELLYYPD